MQVQVEVDGSRRVIDLDLTSWTPEELDQLTDLTDTDTVSLLTLGALTATGMSAMLQVKLKPFLPPDPALTIDYGALAAYLIDPDALPDPDLEESMPMEVIDGE